MWYVAAVGLLISAAALMIDIGLMLLSGFAFGIIVAIMLLYSPLAPSRISRLRAALGAVAGALSHVSGKVGRLTGNRQPG